jgi:UDP:flavonoid glycosyltransferase YjiC (YdhE family)
MSRFLLTWELGLNLGHVARLLPVASRLKARGHAVLVAVRDIAAAATVLGPAGISFVQAPQAMRPSPASSPLTGYADILLAHGWNDPSTLWGLTQSWLNLYSLFKPDVVVHDYSPTARLASRLLRIPSVLVGNGFDLPPATFPMRPFPGFSWATPERAAASEHAVLRTAGAVTKAFRGSELTGLKDLLETDACLLATFPELDHYGARPDGDYVGPLYGRIDSHRVEWPQEREWHIFAYLRPELALDALLGGLVKSNASVVCFAPGVPAEKLGAYRCERITFSTRPVDFESLYAKTDVCLSYAAEGTVASFLRNGVPQLLAPRNVEGQMTARRIEDWGGGLALRGAQTDTSVAAMLERVSSDSHYKKRAQAFAERYAGFNREDAANRLVERIERIAREATGGSAIMHPAA